MEKHTKKEDWIAILTGTFLVAQGVFFLQHAGLLTGGITGLALLVSQFIPLSFGGIFFILNLPFYYLAWKRFSAKFALTSLVSGALVSFFADNLDHLIQIDTINTLYCAISGGLLMGLGMLILFRHHASLGGFNVLCLFIQDKTGLSIGKSQLMIDCVILFASFFFVPLEIIGLSVLGAIALNVVLAMNHKPIRYSANRCSAQN